MKTVKSKLLESLESGVEPEEGFPDKCCMIFHGMVLLQQLEGIPLSMFGDISEFILKIILRGNATNIYFVIDQYLRESVKGYERSRRSANGTLRVGMECQDQKKPNQLKKYFRNDDNKREMTQFLLDHWSHEGRFNTILKDRIVFFNCCCKFYQIMVSEGIVRRAEE